MTRLSARLAQPAAYAHGSGESIGFVGADIPIEVLLASGGAFGHLPWHTEKTPWADGWLESSFPGWARSILEQWHEGAFDGLRAVVFSRTDDATQRLYYYVRELQQRGVLDGPLPLVFDMAHVPRPSSLEHTAQAVLALAAALDVPPHALPAAIVRANALRISWQELQQRRVGQGDCYENLARAALWNNPSAVLADFLVVRESAQSMASRRVLLAGSFPPDARLHAAVESAGASVTAEGHVFALDRLGLPLTPSDAAPAHAIARQLTACSVGPRAFHDRARALVERARSTQAHAVILWLTREDEALAWHVPAQRQALAAAGMPALILTAAQWLADDGAPERIAEFCRETFR